MPALVTFTDFLLATQEKVITPSMDILNDAVKNSYILKTSLRGRGDDEVFQGGSRLTDRIMLEDNGSFQFYEPNQEFNPTTAQVLTKISVNWRFVKSDYSYTDEEILLNEGGTEVVFKKLKRSHEQASQTAMFNGMEDACWAFPSASSMEADAGKVAYSIPAFIDELGSTANYRWPGFTTIMTVDPAAESRWRNQISRYNSATPYDQDDGIIAAFDDQWLAVMFESPDTASEYFENDLLNKMKILSNRDGVVMFKRALRALNDRTVSPQDPSYNDPVYSGVPVKYISTLDTALLDQTAASSTPAAWSAGSPRYYFLNFEYLFPIYHSDRYMSTVGPIPGGPKQPFSSVVYKNTYYNWFLRSRQRQGIVTPALFGT